MSTLKLRLLVLLFILGSTYTSAQIMSPLCVPPQSETMPEWARTMYQKPLNMLRVDSAYEAYYKQHAFVKDNYVKYYKRLRRLMLPFIEADGSVRDLQPRDFLRSDEKRASALQSPTAGVQWTPIGPMETYTLASHTSSPQLWPWQTNTYAFDVSISNPNIVYAVTETGGFFKSTNKGKNWTQLEPGVYSNSEAVAIHPNNPDIVYVGISGGLLRSNDGGKTWRSIWSQKDLWIYDLEVHASNTSIIYAATNHGFYRTSDAGVTWTQSMKNTCADLETKPTNHDIVYSLRINDAGTKTELWKSVDAGLTFTLKSAGWLSTSNSSGSGRMTVTPADPERIYVVLLGDSSRPYVLRSDNAGENWRVSCRGTSDSLKMNNGQGYYDLSIMASHQNADDLIVATTTAYRSSDGGNTFPNTVGGYSGTFPIHPDIQEMKCIGGDYYISTDGGFNYSNDFYKTNWEARTVGLNGADFWGFDAGWNEDVLVGGRYHNGNTAWHENYGTKFLRLGGGEAATGYVNPMNSRTVFFSDIGAYDIPSDFQDFVVNRTAGAWPNESYYQMENSEMKWDPRCYSDVWIGSGNSLMLSHNNGQSYETVWSSSDTGATIQHIEICRSNPDVMYVSQRSNILYDGKIWKSIDGGKTFSACTPFPNTTRSERRVMKISASGRNANVLFAACMYTSAGNKVFKTTDGGRTWQNLSTATIADGNISDIMVQYGTEDGVYISASNGRVYYRNNTMNDWVLHGTGLPYALMTRALKPFYRDNKIRSGSSMGIWEAPLYEHSRPEAMPSVDKRSTRCERDTFYFSDYSVLERANAKWHWSFPGASYVSDSTAMSPKVLYSKPGLYSATLTVTNDYGTDTRTLQDLIQVFPSECAVNPMVGNALNLSSTKDMATIPALPLMNNARGLTVMCWLKLDTIQQSFSQILSNWASPMGFSFGFSFQGYRANTNLTFYWKNVPYQLTSPFNLPVGDWVHVAISVESDHVTLYMNGSPWVYKNSAANFKDISMGSTPWEIGGGVPGQGGNFRGQMDELRIYRRPLDSNEIRQNMHLTYDPLRPTVDTIVFPEPVAYFQFDESTDTRFYNRVGAVHASNSGGRLIPSTAPVGYGYSEQAVIKGGAYTFHNGMQISRSDDSPRMVVLSQLVSPPDSLPLVASIIRQSPVTHFVHAYNGTAVALPVDSIRFAGIGTVSASDANNPDVFRALRRSVNEHRNSWTSAAHGISADTSMRSVSFGSDTNAVGQYIVGTSGSSLLDVAHNDNDAAQLLQLLPNPSSAQLSIWFGGAVPAHLIITDLVGRQIMERELLSAYTNLDISALNDGHYQVQVRNARAVYNGALRVVH